MDNREQPRPRRLVLLVWLLVGLFYFYLSYDYIRVSNNDKKLGEYIDYVVQLAGRERRPAKEVRALILVKADELGLSISGEQITILGGGPTLNVSIDYGVDVEIPFFERVIYRKNFQHKAMYQPQR